MWPKLFELLPGLIDALPHLDRFSNVADRFIAARSGNEAALVSSHEALRADLDRIDTAQLASNAVLTRKLDELSSKITTAADDAQSSRAVTVALGHSIVAIERQLRALRALLVSVIILAVLLALMTGWLVLAHPR